MQSLFGPGGACTALTVESASACGEDAARRLGLALRIEPDADGEGGADAACDKWSGAAVATLPCGSRVLVSSGCIQRLLGMPPPSPRPSRSALSSVLQAASGCATRVEARLTPCDLDLVMLQRLQVGDVVRLPHALTQPIGLHVAGDRQVFAGFLARSGPYRSLELVPSSPEVDAR